MEWSIVFKALSPLAGRVAAGVAPNLFRSWLVAYTATRQAKNAGFRVKYFQLRRVIDDQKLFKTFHSPSTNSLDVLVPFFRPCIRRHGDSDPDQFVPVLLAILADAYVHSLPAAQASRFEGERTREHFSSEVARLQEGSADDRNFAANCSLLNPLRGEGAQVLLDQWPPLPRVVAAIVQADDRRQLFRDWTVAKPGWLESAPASALCWLALVALDYGEKAAAHTLLSQALAAGASPRSYWQARLVLTADLPREEVENLLNDAKEHPLAACLLSNLHGEQEKALEEIHLWEPTTSESRATKSLVMAQLLVANDNFEDAIQTSLEGYEETGSTGCALYAAKLLLGRGSLRKHPAFMGDLAKGLELATKVRASRLIWGGDSPEAVVVIISAYRLMGSPDDAWRAGRPSPDGRATALEAIDARVSAETARTAAELGMTQQARELMQTMESSPTKSQLEATLAEVEYGPQSAIPLWTDVLKSIADPVDALNIGLRLAHHGQEIDWPQWLRDNYDEDVKDIELISALFRAVPGALQKARARAASSRQVFHGLMSFHAASEKYIEAAEVAEAGGKRWNDPEAWLGAAEWYLKGDDRNRAINAAELALRVGGTAWLGERRARIILIENRSGQGQWDKALIEATRLLELEPDNDSSKWAFITCQYMTADYRGAWQSLGRFGDLEPQTADNARMAVQLHSRFAASMDFLEKAKHYAAQWPENEQLRATIVVSLLESRARPALQTQVARYQELITGFIKDFPDSSIFRSIAIDEENPVESMRTLLVEQLEAREDSLAPILNGEVPLGMATHISGKSYAEVCVVRGAGKVFAGDPNTLEAEVEVIFKNFDQRVVVDTTTLSTLSLLDPQVGREWLGLFSSGLTPLQSVHDLQTAAASLSTKSTATVGIDKTSGALRIAEISDYEAERRAERAESMLAMGKELEAVSHPEIVELPHLHENAAAFRWLLALDLAKNQNVAFWCDDKALRSLAGSTGVESFGTPALLEALRRNGSLGPSEVELYEAQLIHSYYTGIRVSPSVMNLAAEMDSWMPLGTAAAVSEAGPTVSPDVLVGFVLSALSHCTAHPEAIEAWVTAGSTWLESVSADSATATENVRLWFSSILRSEWMSSSCLPFVLSGLRSTTWKADLEQIVPEVFRMYYAEVAEQTDYATAALYLRDLIKEIPASDRSAVLRSMIAP